MRGRYLLIRTASAAAVVAFAAAAPATASAQTPDEGRHYDPESYYLDGPPDDAACVKLCPRDLSPCDPPLYKKTDGRCNRSHGD